MQDWIVHLFHEYPVLVYGVIIIISWIEGPILALFCGLLIKLNAAPLIPVYFALMVGDLCGDVFWYFIGYHFGHRFIKRFGHYFSITEESITVIKKIFNKYKGHILIISKITMGFGFALVTLITAGIIKIPFKQYFTLNFIGQFVWTATLLFIGYEFGNVYLSINGILGKMFVVALFVIAFAALLGYGKYIKNRVMKKSTSL